MVSQRRRDSPEKGAPCHSDSYTACREFHMGLNVLIADDEPLGRERLRNALEGRTDVTLKAEASDGGEAVRLLSAQTFDLVFLDIQMPFKTGFQVVEAIGAEAMPPVVFVTAYDEYALRAFEVNALDYLLKPFDEQRFNRCLDRVIALAGDRGDLTRRMEAALAQMTAAKEYPSRLMVKGHQSMEFVRVEDIDWIEASGNYLTLHAGKKEHLTRQTMSGLEERLNPEQFLRIHRSTIVNIERIRDLRATFKGDYQVRLLDGTELRLSRGYRSALKRFEE